MMESLHKRLTALCAAEEGLTTVEYAVAGTLVTLAVIAAFTNLGAAVFAQIQAIVTVLTG
jgi:pilus assembly protein Flp/PilA